MNKLQNYKIYSVVQVKLILGAVMKLVEVQQARQELLELLIRLIKLMNLQIIQTVPKTQMEPST